MIYNSIYNQSSFKLVRVLNVLLILILLLILTLLRISLEVIVSYFHLNHFSIVLGHPPQIDFGPTIVLNAFDCLPS